MDRRKFIKNSTWALCSAPFMPGLLASQVQGNRVSVKSGYDGPVLVSIFLRGGADGLNIVVPFGDNHYEQLRPNIKVPAPGGEGGAIDADGFFGFHPRMTGIKALFDQERLAVVTACGSHNPTRSHFDAMHFMEGGSSAEKLYDGWLNRYLQLTSSESIFHSVALGSAVPLTMAGSAAAIALVGLESLQVGDSAAIQTYLEAIGDMHQPRGDFIGGTALSALQAISQGRDSLDPGSYTPDNGTVYPETEFAGQLKEIAQLIKAGVGLETATIDVGGWDTHSGQGNGENGRLADQLTLLDGGLAAVVADLGEWMEKVVILVTTEFGRTAAENGSGGTDHGHATSMFVLGGNINGGRILGQWPGLVTEQLYEGRDLAVTTDFRRLFGEVLEQHMKCNNLGHVFPGYDYHSDPAVGLFNH
ncbi:MAG: DUF1501 domain-containing protein [bacterium]|nr:DUF1501 domain-containing protein [bacterium]